MDWDGGELSTDAGWLLLSLIDQRLRLTEGMAACILDLRDPHRVDHQLPELLRQRIYQIAGGYEDGNDPISSGTGHEARGSAVLERLLRQRDTEAAALTDQLGTKVWPELCPGESGAADLAALGSARLVSS